MSEHETTDANRAINALRENRRFTHSALDALSSNLAILSIDGLIKYTNRAWRNFAVQNQCAWVPDMIGVNYLDIADHAIGNDVELARAAAAGIRAVGCGKMEEYEQEYPCNSPGRERWFRMRVTRFIEDDTIWIVVAHDDITERRRAEEEMRRSEDKFSRAFCSNPEIMIISDLETGKFIDVNETFIQTTGFTREEVIGRTSADIGLWIDLSQRAMLYQHLIQGKPVRNWILSFRNHYGETIHAHLSADRVEIGERACALITINDITQLENARRVLEGVYERERWIADTLQRNFLPDAILLVEGYNIADAYYPALDEAVIGGDVYDVFRLPDDKVGLMVADVSGKGLKAGRYGAMVKYMLRAYAYKTANPAEVLDMLNVSIMMNIDIETFVTCFYGVLDPKVRLFTYANAGHDEPLLISREGHTDKLAAVGSALGINPNACYTSKTVELSAGETVFLYTDGVTDARGVEESLGVDGLTAYILENCSLSASSLVQCVVSEVRRRSGDVLRDDVAILAMEVLD